MTSLLFSPGSFSNDYFQPTADYIESTQQKDGAIPWFEGSFLDPWDHVESAMGLSICGRINEAEKAYEWMRNSQLPDGSWWTRYVHSHPDTSIARETNMVAYIAVGVWHHYLITEDTSFLLRMWPTVDRAMDFVCKHQAPTGEIYWAVNNDGTSQQDALVTGCSSIYKSFECALEIADQLNQLRLHWERAMSRLGEALRYHPQRFDRTWAPKSRYSMDWFYPVLTGVYTDHAATHRLESRWDEFVHDGLGCRCVSDRPWMTVAESCELTIALLAAGERTKAVNLYGWLHDHRDDHGAFWTGITFPEYVIWPIEKPTWTSAAMLLAADALTEHTNASGLFMPNEDNDLKQRSQKA